MQMRSRAARVRPDKRMKLATPPRVASGAACSPFGEHRGFRSLSVCSTAWASEWYAGRERRLGSERAP